jgi:uncharacterized protein (TIRG00374 family)
LNLIHSAINENEISENDNAVSSGKKILYNLIRIFIAAGLILFIILKVNISEIFLAIRNADILYIILAFLLTFINLFLQYWKWQITCKSLLDETNNRKIFLSLFYGLSGGVFTPVRIGEYFGRAIEFKEKSILKISVATFIDKIFPMIILVFFGSISCLPFLYFYYGLNFYFTIILLAAIILMFFLLIQIFVNQKYWDSSFFSFVKSLIKKESARNSLKMFRNLQKKYLLQMTGISVLFYICILTQFSLLVSAFSLNFRFLNYFWAGNLVMFVKSIIPSISFAELGIREGASIFFLSKMGEPSFVAFDAAFFLFLINVLLPALIGFVLLFKRNNG